jgi:hypothetical protein
MSPIHNCGCLFASSFHVQANNSGPGLLPSCHSALQQQPKSIAQIVQPPNQPFQQTPYQQSQPPRSSSILNAPRQIVAPERQLPHQTRPPVAQDTVRIFCCSFYLYSAAIRSERFQLPFLLLVSRVAQAQDRTQSPNRMPFLSLMIAFHYFMQFCPETRRHLLVSCPDLKNLRKKRYPLSPVCNAIVLFVLQARLGKRLAPPPNDLRANTGGQKSLGGKKSRGFIPPFRRDEENDDRGSGAGAAWSSGGAQGGAGAGADIEVDERLKNIDPKLVELITNEMLNRSPNVKWCDIAGLDFAKQSVQEIVVWPMLRPDIFTGLRGPPKGLLLFGPPGAINFIRLLVHRRLNSWQAPARQ